MRASSRLVVGVLGLGVAVAAAQTRTSAAPPVSDAPIASINAVQKGLQLQDGDVILRRGSGLISRAVLAADPAAGFSHAGIVVVRSGNPEVVHAEPSSGRGAGRVIVEPLARYLRRERARGFAVLRLRRDWDSVGHEAATAALAYAAAAVPFDDRFDSASADRLYCTELVWRVFASAGLDVLHHTRGQAGHDWVPKDLIHISEIQSSQALERIGGWPNESNEEAS